MDKKYQDVHLRDKNDVDDVVLRKCMLTYISFGETTMIFHIKDDVGRERIMILPKLSGYKLIID